MHASPRAPRRSSRPISHAPLRGGAIAAARQEAANAFFKRHSKRSCPSLATGEVAIAVHAAVYIPPYTPVLVHYGDEYKRDYEVGEKCKALPLTACQNPCDAMPWRTWHLPHDAYA